MKKRRIAAELLTAAMLLGVAGCGGSGRGGDTATAGGETTPAETTENGKFSFLFDNCKGFNNDLAIIFEGAGEASLMDAPVYFDGSFTQLREENCNTVESILQEYRDKMAETQ